MSDLLRLRPAATPAMLAVYEDRAVISHALAFEGALARTQADHGLIGQDAARTIVAACADLAVDPAALAEEVALAGTLAIPLVKRLRAALPDAVAPLAHKGATSRDVADTVMMLQAKAAADLLCGDLDAIAAALALHARRHAATPAIGRTLLQNALPIGFGLRIAQWHAGLAQATARLRLDIAAHACLQLGGAAGTRAGLNGEGAAIAAHMAAALGLADAPPWQARRVGVAAIASSLAIMIGALAKMARDVSLLAQDAIGEAREPVIAGRGGSSAMAHKRNPTGCQVALAAHARAPGLVAGIVSGMAQEQERGLGGWQAEGPALADLFLLAAGSAAALLPVAQGLDIDDDAIARNLAAAGGGADMGAEIGESAALTTTLLALSEG